MNALINFFTGLVEVIKTVIDFLIGFIEDLVELVVLVGQAALEIPKLFGMLPPPIIAALTIGLSVVVIFKILGREG